MLNAILGAAVGIFVVLMAFAFWSLMRSLKEFTESISVLTAVLKPFLSNPNLPAVVESLPAFVNELRSISKGVGAMTLALAVFNKAVLSKDAAGAAVPLDDSGLVVPYNEAVAAGTEEELLRTVMKMPPTG